MRVRGRLDRLDPVLVRVGVERKLVGVVVRQLHLPVARALQLLLDRPQRGLARRLPRPHLLAEEHVARPPPAVGHLLPDAHEVVAGVLRVAHDQLDDADDAHGLALVQLEPALALLELLHQVLHALRLARAPAHRLDAVVLEVVAAVVLVDEDASARQHPLRQLRHVRPHGDGARVAGARDARLARAARQPAWLRHRPSLSLRKQISSTPIMSDDNLEIASHIACVTRDYSNSSEACGVSLLSLCRACCPALSSSHSPGELTASAPRRAPHATTTIHAD